MCTMNAIAPLTGALTAAGVNYAPQIVGAAERYGLDPRLLAAVAAQETGGPGQNGGHNVVGDGGHGHGVFQIDDRSHAFATTAAAMNPAANADYAASMLSGLLHRFGGNVRAALRAYNSGSPTASGTRTTWADGRTLDYADSVLRHYGELGGQGGSDALGDRARSCPVMPQAFGLQGAPWHRPAGNDPTGHRTAGAMSFDTYINGDSDTP